MGFARNVQIYKLLSYKNAAAALRVARVAAGLSAGEAAHVCGITQSDFSRIENGHRQYMTQQSKEKLEKLAAQLNVSIMFEETSWTEVRRKSNARKAKKATSTSEKEDLFAATEAPAPAPVRAQESPQPLDQLALLYRLTEQGVLTEAAFSDAIKRVLSGARSVR